MTTTVVKNIQIYIYNNYNINTNFDNKNNHYSNQESTTKEPIK